MADTTITLNLNQPTELEFELTTNGLSKDTVPTVRFMILDEDAETCQAFPCKKVDKKNWEVHIPKLNVPVKGNYTFTIECIIEGHHFVPAEGSINIVDKPAVKIGGKTKPKEVDLGSVKPLKEGAEAADITGQYAPTGSLLKPERKPKESKSKTPKTEPMDELIDRDALGDFEPGKGGKQYAQDDGKEGLDPRDIVDKILSRNKTTESITPVKKGKLFARDSEGKPVIPGLETPEQKARILETNKKIKEILKKK